MGEVEQETSKFQIHDNKSFNLFWMESFDDEFQYKNSHFELYFEVDFKSLSFGFGFGIV